MDLDVGRIVMQYVCLLFSLCVHEASHAAMANRCGDPSARLLGRMTLNPIKHADILGTVILPLLMFITGFPYMFGWAKPVPFNPRNLNDMRRDPVLIAIAGPGANFIVAILGALVLRVLAVLIGSGAQTGALFILFSILIYLVIINAVLMLFNLIPVPPLDGHYVLGYLLGPAGQRFLDQIGPFGILIALVLVNQFGILTLPMHYMKTALFVVAFYGTPVWGMLN